MTTLAGFGEQFGSVDGTGFAARFKGPSGVAVDAADNVYVADQGNHTIRKLTSAGVVSTVAGLAGYGGGTNGSGENARFGSPAGMAVDSAGNIYVSEQGNNTIRKITPDGTNWIVTTLAGVAESQGSADGPGSAARFAAPSGLAVGSTGNLYVADSGNHTIRVVTSARVVTTRAGLAGASGSNDGVGNAARFNNPAGVAVDRATNIYVADTWNHTIRRITPDRIVRTLAGAPMSAGSADGEGNAARFNYPSGIALDSSGNLYVSDTFNNSIRKVALRGTNWVVTTLGGMSGLFGSADGIGKVARFSNPVGLAADSLGNLYIADFYYGLIRRATPPARFSNPARNQNGAFVSVLSGTSGQLLIVDASPDLANWQPISTNIFSADINFSDPDSALFSHRFYRSRVRGLEESSP